MSDRWNHNIHYHPVIRRALPPGCERVLDVGCREGVLARQLSGVVAHVTAVDLDGPTVEQARVHAGADNIAYVVGDILANAFAPASFDGVVSVAALHHVGTAAALARIRELLRPGGTLAVVGLARSRFPADLPFDLAGAAATRLHQLIKGVWETTAPKVWPPPETYGETRLAAEAVLPGARFRRHVLWRYSLVWRKPSLDP